MQRNELGPGDLNRKSTLPLSKAPYKFLVTGPSREHLQDCNRFLARGDQQEEPRRIDASPPAEVQLLAFDSKLNTLTSPERTSLMPWIWVLFPASIICMYFSH